MWNASVTLALIKKRREKEKEKKEMEKEDVNYMLHILKAQYSKGFEAMDEITRYGMCNEWRTRLAEVDKEQFINTLENHMANNPTETWPDLDELLKAYEEEMGEQEADKGEEIKGCPFCGGEPYIRSQYSNKTRMHFVMVKCSFCGAQGKIYNSKENPQEAEWNNAACKDAINAWNKRTYC